MSQNPAASPRKTVPAMLADTDFLFRQAKLGAEAFIQAQPFPHLYLQSLIKPSCCQALYEGLGMAGKPPVVRMLEWELSSSTLIRHFTSMTGKPPLLPDPFLIHAGATMYHNEVVIQTAEQQYFARHPETQLQNVLRVELYVSDASGATFAIEMINRQGDVAASHIGTNGSVLFVNSDHYHLRYCFSKPSSWRSLLVYYYVNDRARALNGEEQPRATY